MADMPYGRYAASVTGTESALQRGSENVANMSGGLQDIAGKTGASEISASEIPSIGGLANMKANINTQSAARMSNNLRMVKGLPAYASGYRQYLMWRYPTRYGSSGSSSTTTNYTPGGVPIPELGITPVPGMKK